jgi:hypothetical protein
MRLTGLLLALIGIALIPVLTGLTQADPTPLPRTAVAQQPGPAIMPSITPLNFSAPGAQAVPFGMPLPTPVPGAANAQPTLLPTSPPIVQTSASNPGSVIVITATPQPGTIIVPAGQISSTVGNLAGSIFDLIGGMVSTLWGFVGQQGGWLLQVLCCFVPFIAAFAYLTRRLRRILR